jgi:alpha-beta hydrolase superfamily lysophospholipase
MIHTELCRFKTADGETLHGLLFKPSADATSDRAILHSHGVASSFYTTPLVKVAQALAEQGHHSLVINSRGHDWAARAGADGSQFMGASYENFEDSPLDIDGALSFLADRGYSRFVLAGHSLGAVKTVYYQGLKQRADVEAVIAASPPRQFYGARVEEQPGFAQKMADAEKMVADGRGEEIIWAWASSSLSPFTARTFVSKYGPHERNDVRRHAALVGVPLLAFAGGAESKAFETHARELAEAAGERGTWHIVPKAVHSYEGHEPLVNELVGDWLARVLASQPAPATAS